MNDQCRIELLGQLNRETIFGEGSYLVQEGDGASKREGAKDFFGLIRRKKRRTEWKREGKVDEEDSGKKREEIC